MTIVLVLLAGIIIGYFLAWLHIALTWEIP